MTAVDLAEAGPAVLVDLDAQTARRLAAAGIVDVRAGPAAGSWRIRADRHVGAARIAGLNLYMAPKVPVTNLLFLLGYARDPRSWRPEAVAVDASARLVPAFAGALWRQSVAALRAGLLQGYRVVDDTGPVLRGRIREVDQMGRRFGAPTPLELRHDEYTVDITENRILATATDRMLHVPGIAPPAIRMLRHVAALLADVTVLRPGQQRPQWTPTRLNARYHTALRLAELVLDATSITADHGTSFSNGFLLDMPRVFEDFLTAALRATIETRYGGAVVAQFPDHLDHGRSIAMVPDLLWRRRGVVSAVVDAKYKAHTPSADVYQMLAYCTAYRLRQGHLVYVTGDHPAGVHRIRNADVEIVRHGLDLAVEPETLLAQVDQLADCVVREPAVTQPEAAVP